MENRTSFQMEMNLYQELLDCLEDESQALMSAQEEAILAAAVRKEALLDRLLQVKRRRADGPEAALPDEEKTRLATLQRRIAAINAENREIAAASLEIIREFLAQFQPPGPGLYQSAAQVTSGRDGALFQRQA